MTTLRGWVFWLCVVLHVTGCYTDRRRAAARGVLAYVDRVSHMNCSSGTIYKLYLQFNYTDLKFITEPGINTANYLAMNLAVHKSFNKMDDTMFFAMVRNHVRIDEIVCGSSIGLEPGVYRRHRKFCPYAYKRNKTVFAYDVAAIFDYLSNQTIWYYPVTQMNFSRVQITHDVITFSVADPKQKNVTFEQPLVTYRDGQWTLPYFQCGVNTEWRVSFISPILFITKYGKLKLKGVVTMDVDLTDLDISQCDPDEKNPVNMLDFFQGTHGCQPTTHCVQIKGFGFRRGGYICPCDDGYYFPDMMAKLQAFRGTDIENYTDLNRSDIADRFKCLPCARGCVKCEDDSPCTFEINITARVLVVAVDLIMIIACCCVSYTTYKYRYQKIIRTGSPLFLQIMCVGAVVMCCQILAVCAEVTNEICILEIWLFHLGFTILYGALNVKTWRIATIFTLGMTKKVNLPNKKLLMRLLQMLFCMVVYLSCWTAINPPRVITVTANNKLAFFVCEDSMWTYGVYGVEGLLMLYGVYLCFVVRKAPVYFNESRHIAWATYNAIIIGGFLIVSIEFLAANTGPDILYFLQLALLQAIVTTTMVLIFGPKIWALIYPEYTADWHLSYWRSSESATKTTNKPEIVWPINTATQTDIPESSPQPPTT